MTLQELKQHIWLSDDSDFFQPVLAENKISKLESMRLRLQSAQKEKSLLHIELAMSPKEKSQL
jgi:hypothetical protein